jgi:putative sigma-54 modulation protein
MYSSIDLCAARIERQVRKWKDKIRDHKPHGGPQASVRTLVIPAEELEPRPGATPPPVQQAVPTEIKNEPGSSSAGLRVIKDETFSARAMRVEDAVMQLNLLGDELLVFTDAESQSISVLYRRKDGNYGLIETGRSGAGSDRRST